MRIGISWRVWEPVRKKSPLARFRDVLWSASRTSFYASSLRDAGLATFEGISTLESIHDGLRRLPIVELDEFQQSCPLQFLIRPARYRPRMPYSPPPQVVDLAVARRLRSCQAIAASSEDLLALARAAETGRVRTPAVERAIFPFSAPDAGELTPEERDCLWHAFQVPIFEQVLGIDGNIMAAECVAHDGFHLQMDHAVVEIIDNQIVFTSLATLAHPIIRVCLGMNAELRCATCPCGRTEPRLMNLRPVAQTQFTALIA